jgi:hypothetical protein
VCHAGHFWKTNVEFKVIRIQNGTRAHGGFHFQFYRNDEEDDDKSDDAADDE